MFTLLPVLFFLTNATDISVYLIHCLQLCAIFATLIILNMDSLTPLTVNYLNNRRMCGNIHWPVIRVPTVRVFLLHLYPYVWSSKTRYLRWSIHLMATLIHAGWICDFITRSCRNYIKVRIRLLLFVLGLEWSLIYTKYGVNICFYGYSIVENNIGILRIFITSWFRITVSRFLCKCGFISKYGCIILKCFLSNGGGGG